jgi:glycosyltransferase 2 family protein
MKKLIINILKYTIFLGAGVLIFWLMYRKFQMRELLDALKEINYFWIVISILFGILSNISRAMRWKMLIKPLGYNPKLSDTFLSVYIMYFINLIIPRAGEVARCTVLSRTDKIPFTKLVGTVFVERLADFIMLLVLVIVVFAMNYSDIFNIFETNKDLVTNAKALLSLKNLLILSAVIALGVLLFIYIRSRLKKSNRKRKLIELRNHLVEGVKSIAHMENKGYFIGHTAFIFIMWLFMMYVVFLAFPPTANLSLRIGTVTFLMGGLAMLAPIQAGIGPWHFMVYITLIHYGISDNAGKLFALIAHTSINLIYLIFGVFAILILLYSNQGLKKINFKTIKEEQKQEIL